jgi:hypothetical protein
MINTTSMFDTKSAPRLLLAGILLGTVALLGACSPTETRTTTTEQTTTHQVVPTAPVSTSVTTTKTQVITP